MGGLGYDDYREQTASEMEQLLSEAEAQWSVGDDERAAVTLERALALVWGRPDEVSRVSETAMRLVSARPSEALSSFVRRAAEGAEGLEVRHPGSDDVTAQTVTDKKRMRLGLIQLAIFTLVVIAVVVVQYLEALR